MGKDRVFWYDLAERVIVTFFQGFVVAAFVVAGVQDGGTSIALPGFSDLFSIATLQGGVVGGVLSLGKGFLAGQFGDRDSAALLSSPPDFAGSETPDADPTD
jgi:hypothetical protein